MPRNTSRSQVSACYRQLAMRDPVYEMASITTEDRVMVPGTTHCQSNALRFTQFCQLLTPCPTHLEALSVPEHNDILCLAFSVDLPNVIEVND